MRFKELFLGFATPGERVAKTTINRLKRRTNISPKQQDDLQNANRISRKLFLRRLALAGRYLIAVGSGITAKILLSTGEQPSELGVLKKSIPLEFSKENELKKMDVFIFETQRPFDFDHEAFANTVNAISKRNGKLPAYSQVILSDKTIDPKDPTRFGATSTTGKFVRLSIKDGFNAPFLNYYPKEAVLNGVLVGEMTNLMISESGTLPKDAGNTERLGNSTGIMACAIFSGRSYQQYLYDTTQIEYMGTGGTITFSEDTYKDFQQQLQPALRFKK